MPIQSALKQYWNIKYLKRAGVIFIIIFALVAVDLWLKDEASENLKYQERLSFLNESFHLVYAENKGGMLSWGSDLPDDLRNYIFQGFVSLALLGLILLAVFHKNINNIQRFAITLFIGGGIGNLFSRVFNEGIVVDYMVIELFEYKTGIFNAADVFITAGMIIILISNFFIRRSHRKLETENNES